ncbi:orotate phosphoribosyltransferase [Pajaroellobacter abortibovis]|uniref:Orotate phosphoribosyltransferase n=1 Tax=Pajaroellobacter abortibovis TaxID=1882918 RepID=A0A1L6MYX8_9BACT|nr:orotate phosphoribosyltransferase [Pajaroellobacter abortibovis]APS00700.1 orotate phosphoribosyltransferase [Pajaroellobacter abortibovis]
MSPFDRDRNRLFHLLWTYSWEERPVLLASGRPSHFFIDCKRTVLRAEGHALVGSCFWEMLQTLPKPCSAIAGVELGGCPLVSAVACLSFQKGHPLDGLYVRKSAKDHGSMQLIEGGGHLPPGTAVVFLEDVITTGSSALKAARHLQEGGYQISGIVALVDREEGGREAIEQANIPCLALFTQSDFRKMPPYLF